MIEPIWDDDRLRRAYGDRFGRPAPAGFAAAVAEAARGRGRSPSRMPAFVALATTIAIAIVLGAAALAPRPRDNDPERRFAHGLPVLTVSDALAIRRASPEAREIAVKGFLSPAPPGIRCPFSGSHSLNPVRLECPAVFGWLLETPDPLDGIRSSLPPGRVGLQPLFPGLDTTPFVELAGREGDGTLPEVVLIGHFHDRRGGPNLCDVPEPEACDGFVATAIVSIQGQTVAASTVIDLEPLTPAPRREPVWTPDDVDRLLLATIPDLDMLSRVALPGHRIGELEPALGTGALGVIDRPLAWVVNALQPDGDGHPRLRTFLIVDGAPDEAYEASNASRVGFAAINLGVPPVSPSATPRNAHVSFPPEIHGLRVISVAEALAEVTAAPDSFGFADTELAVRGYYIVPPDSVACQLPRDDIEPLPPADRECPEGLVWLLQDPERPWDLVDGVARWHRPIHPALHPIVGPNVPFELPRLFRDTSEAEPLAVIVVGHFFDASARTDREAKQFIVDALVWHSGEPSGDQTVVTGAPPTEERAVVEARVAAALGRARVTWAAVVDGGSLTGIDPSPNGELLAANSVWRLSRLVEEGGRPVVRYAYTVDGASRIWERGWLAPERRIDIVGAGGSTVVEVTDVPDIIVEAREVPPDEPDPVSPRVITDGVIHPVALSNPPGRANELRIRWTGTDCDEVWSVWLGADRQSIEVKPARTVECQAVGIDIDIVLTFSEPVPADTVLIGSFGAGG